MSSFVEFQALVLDKLCSLESRLSSIETALGIDDIITNESNTQSAINPNNEPTNVGSDLRVEINDYRNKLSEIKSFLSASEF